MIKSNMTLIVCLEGKDGLALASDSRGTFGDPRGVTAQNDTMQKLYKVSDYVGILMCGAGELSVSLIDALQANIKSKSLLGVTPIMEEFRQIATSKYSEWFRGFTIQPVMGSEKPPRPDVSAIIGGYDLDSSGKPIDKKIYILSSNLDFAPQRSNYGFAVGGIPQYALYLFNRLYTKSTTVDELMHLAVYSITETASQDGKVGGAVQALRITEKDKAKELTTEEIDRISKSNDDRSVRLKTSFYSNHETNKQERAKK